MGRFVKGQSGNILGRPKGTPNKNLVHIKVHEMFQDAVDSFSQGDNPLIVIADIMNDPSLLEIIDNPDTSPFDKMAALKLRLQAASDLSSHIIPKLPKELNVNVNHYDIEVTEEELLNKLQEIQQTIMEQKVISEQ